MSYHLVVVRPFSGFSRGATISDPVQVAQIMNSEHRNNIIKVLPAGTPGE